jgi:malonyl-CoA O-methyltransferase
MSDLPVLPIDPAHVVRQFARRGDLEDAQFLYGEIARRMLDRLRYIRIQPERLIDAGCGAGASVPLLRERYPEAAYVGLDACAPLLDIARSRNAPAAPQGMLSRLFGSLGGKRAARGARGGPAAYAAANRVPDASAEHASTGRALGGTTSGSRSQTGPIEFLLGDLAATGLPPESLELVWSNLAMHWHPQPHAVLAEWRRILKVNGLAMFSCLGPGTMKELRQAVADAGLRTATPSFVDMHDFGDLLVENGFADPVMDQETLTLTYKTPERLLEDVWTLGGNPSTGRRAGLATRAWRQRLCDALEAQRTPEDVIKLSIEVSYGHAWRTAARRVSPGETHLSIDAIGGRRSRG